MQSEWSLLTKYRWGDEDEGMKRGRWRGRKQSNEREGLRLGQGERNVEHYWRTREAAFFYGLRTLKDSNLNI